MRHPLWLNLAPALFVLLWAAGFVGAKYGLPYAPPLTFLTIRLALVVAILGTLVLLARAPWPRQRMDLAHAAIAGWLLQGCYLGGVFVAIAHGFPAGTVALVVGLQPVLTACVAGWLLGEHVTRLQWVGFLLGLAGVVLVVGGRFAWTGEFGVGLALSLIALLGITFGTIHQKRYCATIDLRVGALVQYIATLAILAPLAWGLEGLRVVWSPTFLAALAFLVLGLSIGAVFLLLGLIRRGAAARVVSLFYLVPPTTAVIAWLAFGENLGPPVLAGLGLTALGVALVNRPAKAG